MTRERKTQIVCITDSSFDDIPFFECDISDKLDREDYDSWFEVYYEIGRRAFKERIAKDGEDDGENTWKAVNLKLRATEFSYNGESIEDYMMWDDDSIERIVLDVWEMLEDECKES